MFIGRDRIILIILMSLLNLALFNGCSSQNTKEGNVKATNVLKAVNTSKVSTSDKFTPAASNKVLSKPTDDMKPNTVSTSESVVKSDITKAPDSKGRHNVETRDESLRFMLKDKIICIDAGHQKRVNYEQEPIAPNGSELKIKDPGGTSGVYTKIPEYELNLKVSKKLKALLEKMGAQVVMTRENNDVNLGNVDRAKIANKCNANLFIRIHADGSDNSKARGISILVPGNKYVTDKSLLAESKAAAQGILSGLLNSTGAKSRGVVARNDLTGFNWTKVPMVLVEMGFMTNAEEDKYLMGYTKLP